MKKSLIGVCLILGCNASFAANPYTDCGIGAALFPNTGWAAVTSNVIWDAGTTAIISATASENTCSGGAVKTAKLIHDKLEQLETEVLLGHGENKEALTQLLECRAETGLPSSVQHGFKAIISEDSYESSSRLQKSAKIFEALRDNVDVQASCSTLS